MRLTALRDSGLYVIQEHKNKASARKTAMKVLL